MSIRPLKRKLQRFSQLSGEDRRLLLRAAFWIGVGRIWVAAASYPRLAARLRSDAGSTDADPELLLRVGRAVDVAAANVPWRSDCFPRSIAAHKLLQGLGYASAIHIGVDKPGEGVLMSHAWVTCGDIVVVGGEQLDRYVEIHRLGEP
jgi:hypothetical protein